MTAGAGEDVEKEEHSSIVGGLQACTTTLEISLAVPHKIAKQGKRHLNKEFSPEEYLMAEKHLKKMLNSLNHQGNANQNNPEIPPHTSQNG